jgi:hypothetical protein
MILFLLIYPEGKMIMLNMLKIELEMGKTTRSVVSASLEKWEIYT